MARGRSSGRSSSPAPRSAPARSYSTAPAPARTATAPPPSAAAGARHPPQKQQPQQQHAPAQQQHAPAPAHHAPPQQQGGGMFGGLMGTIAQGMAFGTGSAVAHRAVDAVVGPREVKHVHENGQGEVAPAQAAIAQDPAQRCMNQNQQFQQCMRDNAGSISSCQYLFDMLSQCQRDAQMQ